MIINLENIISRVDGKISREIDGETVILDMESGVYVGLDDIGTFVWGLMEEGLSLQNLLNEILLEYDVESQQCLDDLQEFLSELVDGGFIAVH